MDAAARLDIMGSEGFGLDRVTVTDLEACEKTRVSILTGSSSSIEPCSSSLGAKDLRGSVNPLESGSRDNVLKLEFFQHGSQLTGFNNEDVSKELYGSGSNGPSWIPRPEEVQVQRREGKVSRSSTGCLKRQRLAQSEDGSDLAGVDDTKNLCHKLSSCPIKCDSQERILSAKQKNRSGNKRGDRRNSKIPMKTKYDFSSVKAGLASFSSAAGVNNFSGLYGLKTDVHDVTKLVDDLPLKNLLDGTYECPSIGKVKGKKSANSSGIIVHTVRKACSILQLPRPAQFQNFADLDNCSIEKTPTCLFNSVSIVASGDSITTDTSSPNQDSCNKAQTSANLLDFSFDQPQDTLQLLALPPSKDLESLLMDASKPAASSRHAPDPRPGKQTSRRPSLPAFPWSHAFSAHCRTNSDANKILSGKSTCQGRWVRIGNPASSLGTASDIFTNLESLTYDEALVPSRGPKLTILENNGASSDSGPSCGHSLSSAPFSIVSQLSLESAGHLKYPGKVEHCPRLLEAAQILCDIATDALRPNPDGGMAWPRKLSQKAMKARKSKSKEKSEEMFIASTSSMGSDHIVRSGVGKIMPFKKAKISTIENKKNNGPINGVRKGPINWSTPKSCRSLLNKSVRDSAEETRQSTACDVKQLYIMPPPAKILSRSCSGQQKVRKLMRVDWKRERDGQG